MLTWFTCILNIKTVQNVLTNVTSVGGVVKSTQNIRFLAIPETIYTEQNSTLRAKAILTSRQRAFAQNVELYALFQAVKELIISCAKCTQIYEEF